MTPLSFNPGPLSGFKILARLIGENPRQLWMILLLALLSSLATAPAPYLAKIIIDDLIFRGSTAGDVRVWLGVSHTVWMIGAIVLLGIFLKVLGGLLGGWQIHYIFKISRLVLYETRLAVCLTLMGARQEEMSRIEPGSIASRLVNDVNQMDNAFFVILRTFLSSLFLLVVVVGFMLFLNFWLTLVVLATMPVTAALTAWSYKRLSIFSREESDRSAALSAAATETFGSLRAIRAFTAEPFFLDRLREKCDAIRYEGLYHHTRSHAINLLLVILSSLGGDIFLFVGGILAIQGNISFGSFFAFYAYQAMLWGPIGTLLNSGQLLQPGIASAEKIEVIKNVPQEPYLARAAGTPTGEFRGEIVAKNLSFSYQENDPVLRDVRFSIKPGEMVALVGQSGSGKTTLASLLLGMYLPTGGQLLIDGTDISEWDLRKIRANTGAVLQEAALFNDTLRMNLCLGREFPDSRIWAALAAAHLDDLVRSLPLQLDECVGIGGMRLSGGQRQRLAISRVFLNNPSLLILDEATSALDSETEKAIQRSFDALMAGRTSVVIAHRLSTIFHADNILVLHQGRLVESGTHKELVSRTSGHYRALFEAQVEGLIPMSGATRTVRPQSRK